MRISDWSSDVCSSDLDPGELFPWEELARRRLALPRPTRKLTDPLWTDAGFLLALECFGYDVTDGFAAAVAFQRLFRPELIDGPIEGDCRAILHAMLLPQPGRSCRHSLNGHTTAISRTTDGGTTRAREGL